MLLFWSSPVGGSASQIAEHLVNVITEHVNNMMDQTDETINAPETNKWREQ